MSITHTHSEHYAKPKNHVKSPPFSFRRENSFIKTAEQYKLNCPPFCFWREKRFSKISWNLFDLYDPDPQKHVVHP